MASEFLDVKLCYIELNKQGKHAFPGNDECAQEPSPCRPFANCVNTVDSFECDCPAGFVGDGINTCAGKYIRSISST